MTDAYGVGQSFGDFLHGSVLSALGKAFAGIASPGTLVQPSANAAGASGADFVRGALGLGRPSITVPLPAARAAPAVVATDPAALARLHAQMAAAATSPKPAAAAAPAAKGGSAKQADPAAFAKGMSFRQLLALSTVADHLTSRGAAAHPATGPNAASDMLASLYQNQFANTLKQVGNDPNKRQAATDAFEKKMLPLALRGNTADEYLYGQQQPEN
jgi:hypothetical protein